MSEFINEYERAMWNAIDILANQTDKCPDDYSDLKLHDSAFCYCHKCTECWKEFLLEKISEPYEDRFGGQDCFDLARAKREKYDVYNK